MRRVGAPGACQPASRWGRPRGLMRDKVNRGHYMQVVNSMDPAAWWEAEDVSQGSVSSWMGRKATELVQATGEDQPETGKAPTGIPGIFFDGQFVALAFGLFDGESEFSVASTASHDGVAAQGAVIIQRDGDWWNTVSGMKLECTTMEYVTFSVRKQYPTTR